MASTLAALLQALKSKIPEHDARIILETRLSSRWTNLLTDRDRIITDADYQNIQSDCRRVQNGEPVSRIYGMGHFWGRNFEITPDTLDPRQDSETLIALALKGFESYSPQRILDLGTGSGCLLITLLLEWPEAKGVGVDLSFGALKTAQKNAKKYGVDQRASFICGHWAESIAQEFDLIIANPPYIANQTIETLDDNVKNYDPILALDGGDEGLEAYRAIVREIPERLKKSGKVLFEIGFDQGETVSRIVEESALTVLGVHPDLSGQPRVVEISSGDK